MGMEYGYEIDYNDKMLNYYPEFIKAIREFQVLINTQSFEVEELHQELVKLLEDAYVSTANQDRIEQWEQFLNIQPLPQGDDSLETWLNDRRETVMARLYTVNKLNSQSISKIVSIFTGGEAKTTFKDGVIKVSIFAPTDNKSYKFENVEQELLKKVPAHLSFKVERGYIYWSKVFGENSTWRDVFYADEGGNTFKTWREVLYPST